MKRTQNRSRVSLLAVAASAALITTACSSSGSAVQSSAAAVTPSSPAESASASASAAPSDASPIAAALAAFQAPQDTWTGPTDKVTPDAGKKIVSITCSSQGVGCVNAAAGAVDAGAVLGWDVTTVDGKGDPSVWNAAIEQAVTDKADGIILNAVVPFLVQGALEKAKAAGIPVVTTFVPKLDGPTVDAYVISDHPASGTAAADWTAITSEGKAKILLLEEPQFPELMQRTEAFKAEIATACPDCTIVKTGQFNIGTMPQQLPGIVTSALQADPTIDYVIAPFDTAALFAGQGITQSGKTDVQVVGFEGDPDGIQRLAAGQQAADVATVQPWMGWAAVDSLARLFAGQAVAEQVVPQRLFDSTNVPSGAAGWTGDVDYQAQFKALWGK